MTAPDVLAAAREVMEGVAMQKRPRPGHGEYAKGGALISRHVTRQDVERFAAALLEAEAENQRLRGDSERLHKILYAVGSRFPGEERWETALRYVQAHEDRREKGVVGWDSLAPAILNAPDSGVRITNVTDFGVTARRDHPTAEPEE